MARHPVILLVDAQGLEAGVVGIARLTLSGREQVVVVEPRGTGMVLFTLRAADKVLA
jgi:non-homologous end joining protein Ku